MSDRVSISNFVDLPMGRVDLSSQEEEHFVIRARDWNRIKLRVADLGKRRQEFSAIAWACVGILVSAVFTALTWAPAYRTMPQASTIEFAWVWPAICALAALGLLVGGMMFWAAHVTGVDAQTSANSILDEMDDVRQSRAAKPSGELDGREFSLGSLIVR